MRNQFILIDRRNRQHHGFVHADSHERVNGSDALASLWVNKSALLSIYKTRFGQITLIGIRRNDQERNQDLDRFSRCSEEQFQTSVMQLAAKIPGSFYTIVTSATETAARGPLSQARQVFFTNSGIVASDTHVLQAIDGRSVLDPTRVATALLVSPLGSEASAHTLLKGIHAIRGEEYYYQNDTGRPSRRPWWVPIEKPNAARLISGAIDEALRSRFTQHQFISMDASGGIDTSLLVTRARRHGRPFLIHIAPHDVKNPDKDRAVSLAKKLNLPLLLPQNHPRWFDPHSNQENTDRGRPHVAWRAKARYEALAELCRVEGSTIHLSGLGGDELFTPSTSAVLEYFQFSTGEERRSFDAWCASIRIPRHRRSKLLGDRRTYEQWLKMQMRQMRNSTLQVGKDWESPPRIAHWVTKHAQGLAKAAMLKEVASPSMETWRFAQLRAIQAAGTLTNDLGLAFRSRAASFESPLLDDVVVTSTLAAPLPDRFGFAVNKALLHRALGEAEYRSIASDGMKGEYSKDVMAGFRSIARHRVLRPALGSLSTLGMIQVEDFDDSIERLSTDAFTALHSESTFALAEFLNRIEPEHE